MFYIHSMYVHLYCWGNSMRLFGRVIPLSCARWALLRVGALGGHTGALLINRRRHPPLCRRPTRRATVLWAALYTSGCAFATPPCERAMRYTDQHWSLQPAERAKGQNAAHFKWFPTFIQSLISTREKILSQNCKLKKRVWSKGTFIELCLCYTGEF